ncbi:MAG TPA: heat-shock protein, partial [Pseudobdellovibrionaceae bacterium]|nr:heat-shock protein [Pseudobdellovibrionaceae bacterium]
MNFKRTKIWILALGFSFFLMTLGFLWGDRLGLVVMFLISLGLNAVLFYWGDQKVLSKLEARPLMG